MMRREFSSQHHSSSTTTTTSPSSSTATSNVPTSQTTVPSVATTSISPISRRRQRITRQQQQQQYRRSCSSSSRIDSHLLRSAASVSSHYPNKSTSNTIKLALRNPALAHKLHQMALPLSPLVQLTTGAIHADFPTTVLQFWLLTDSQLEALAAFYHQSGAPSPWAAQYPCPVRWRSHAPLEEKRRRMGRFIGLRGCESPVLQHAPQQHIKTEEEIAREARMARLAADDEALRRKTAPGPWGR